MPAKRIADLFGDEEVVLEIVVRSVSSRRRGGLKILTARVADDTGEIKATWFNQPWLAERQRPARLRRGRANRYRLAVGSYDFEGEAETADFAPVYPATDDVAQKRLRDLRAQALVLVRDAGEPLPASLRADEASAAVRRARRAPPAAIAEAEAGRWLAARRAPRVTNSRSRAPRPPASRHRPSLSGRRASSSRARESLPFTLTSDQERAIGELDQDLARSIPMQRLLQGDVGSGKTVVALYALLRAVESGHQGR